MSHPVREAVEAELQDLPEDLRKSPFAAIALTLSDCLDDAKASATSKSLVTKSLLDTLDRLRALAPSEEQEDKISDLRSRIAARRTAA